MGFSYFFRDLRTYMLCLKLILFYKSIFTICNVLKFRNTYAQKKILDRLHVPQNPARVFLVHNDVIYLIPCIFNDSPKIGYFLAKRRQNFQKM